MGTTKKDVNPRMLHSEYWLRKQPLFIRLARLAWDGAYQDAARQRNLPGNPIGDEETFAAWLQRVLDGEASQEPLNGYDNPYGLARTCPLAREQIEKGIHAAPAGIWAVMDGMDNPLFHNLRCELLADCLLSHPATGTKKASDASRQREALVPFLFQTRAAAAGTTAPGYTGRASQPCCGSHPGNWNTLSAPGRPCRQNGSRNPPRTARYWQRTLWRVPGGTWVLSGAGVRPAAE